MPLTTTCPRMVTFSTGLAPDTRARRPSIRLRVLWREFRPFDDLAALHLGEIIWDHQLAVDAVGLLAGPFDRPVYAGVVAVGRLDRRAHLIGLDRVRSLDRLRQQQDGVIERGHERVDDALAVFLLVGGAQPLAGRRIPVEDVVGEESLRGGA